jgi:Surface antigen variable number repeat
MKRLIVAVLFLSGMLLAEVSPPDLMIRHVTLITTRPIDFPERQQIIRAIKLRKEKRAPVDSLTELFREIARDQFQVQGYFKAELSDPEISIVEINSQREVIDLILEVRPGEKYRLGNISFQNEVVFPVDQLRHRFAIADGDVFDISRMRMGLENLRKLYGARGYVNFSAVPDTTIHDADHSISVLIDMDAGHVYRVGRLILDGDEWRPGTKAKLQRDWQKYAGRPYDSQVLDEFLRDEHASPKVKPELLFSIQPENSTSSISTSEGPPYIFDFRMTLANPTACRPAPLEQRIRMCWVAHAEKMPSN